MPLSKEIPLAAPSEQLKTRLENRTAKIGIMGLGYVGLPLALLFTEEKFQITGFDVDKKKVDTLNAGGSYIYRIPSTEIQQARGKGFVATADASKISEMDAVIICVPTPLNEYHEPDLSFITDTTHSIAPHLRAGQLVVLESTTYPGTTEEVMIPILEKENQGGLKAARKEAFTGKEFFVAFSPEREDPGNTTVARRDIPKVVGGLDPQAAEMAAAMKELEKAGVKGLVLDLRFNRPEIGTLVLLTRGDRERPRRWHSGNEDVRQALLQDRRLVCSGLRTAPRPHEGVFSLS